MTRQTYLNISLYQIQLFLIVAECLNFTVASQKLNVTQSTVSKTIASMEYTLGFHLFKRKKNLELTPAGKFLLHEWSNIFRSVELSIDRAYLFHEKQQNSIVIGEPDSMRSDNDYAPAIHQFQKKHPDINLRFEEVILADLINLLEQCELDVVFTISYEIPSLKEMGIKWEYVAESPITITVHEDNPLFNKKHITFADLKNEGFVVLSPAHYPNYIKLLYSLCNESGFEPRIIMHAPNTRSMMTTLLRTGTGIVMANRFIYDAGSPKLKHFYIDNTKSGLIIAWRDNPDKPVINEFVSEIISYKRNADEIKNKQIH